LIRAPTPVEPFVDLKPESYIRIANTANSLVCLDLRQCGQLNDLVYRHNRPFMTISSLEHLPRILMICITDLLHLLQSFMAINNNTPNLTTLVLEGCFLISDAAFARFFECHPEIIKVSLIAARKLQALSLEALALHCQRNTCLDLP
jgi:hypothetical protein